MTQPTKQIYLLRVNEFASDAPAGFNVALVVRATCITCARSVAAGAAGAEGTAVWRDPERSTCKEVKQEGINGVVLRSEA